MIIKSDTIHIKGFALIPIGIWIDWRAAIDRRVFIRRDFYANTRIMFHRQQVINNFKTALLSGIIHARNIYQLGKTANRIIAQKCQHFDDFRAPHFERQLAKSNLSGVNLIRQLGLQMRLDIFHHIICGRVRGH